MISATFIFRAGDYNGDFYRLDASIAAAARLTEGYLGEESWEDPIGGRIANVYYWRDEAGLAQLMRHPDHQEAKRRQGEWLNGYQVIISQVIRSYGDDAIAHPTRQLNTAAAAC
jgi:hypothetical protein